MPSARDCPCCSGAPYKTCCEPLHRGAREAADATALMRSRYAAFAKREVEYLWRTLHPEHEDRALPKEAVLASLRASCDGRKFMGLTIIDSSPPDADGVARVRFRAKIFERGKDRSFTELSEFMHDGVGFRYLRGEIEQAEIA